MSIRRTGLNTRAATILTLAIAMVMIGIVGTAAPRAAADPTATAYSGIGSNSLQDVFDAFTGAAPPPPSPVTMYYIPLHTSAASGSRTLANWDAMPAGAATPGCIVTKLGGGSFDRPNGSANGLNALVDSLTNVGFENLTNSCTGAPATVNGQIDFARSSTGPDPANSPCTTAPQCLDYVPFARDAVSFAYFDHGTNSIKTLTSTQLNMLYSNTTTGTILVGADTVKACLTQPGSGNMATFTQAIGVTEVQAVGAAIASGCYGAAQALSGGGMEENDGNAFYAFASGLPAGTDAVIDFSAASWISQANALAIDRSNMARTNGVDLGAIDALGQPYTGAAPNESPNASFYASTLYGHDAYVVVSAVKFGFPGDVGLKSLFNTGMSAICSANAAATSLKFGLTAPVQSCGTPITSNVVGSCSGQATVRTVNGVAMDLACISGYNGTGSTQTFSTPVSNEMCKAPVAVIAFGPAVTTGTALCGGVGASCATGVFPVCFNLANVPPNKAAFTCSVTVPAGKFGFALCAAVDP